MFMVTKKCGNKKNITGTIIKQARESKRITKTELSHRLELYGIYLHRNELYRIENNLVLIKDFELLALARILDIDLNQIKDCINWESLK